MINKIKVLLAEDSLLEQKLLSNYILSDERFELVGLARNGKEASKMATDLKPDVISMDIIMPGMDGIEATGEIMHNCPVPIVIVSTIYQNSDILNAIKELEAGAVTIIPKPFGIGHPKHQSSVKKYLNTLALMSEIKVVRRKKSNGDLKKSVTQESQLDSRYKTKYDIAIIGASAGGPEGIRTILGMLNKNINAPILIIQHIDPNFVDGFCSWLNSNSGIPVYICRDNEELQPGKAYLPPPGMHLKFKHKGIVSIIPNIMEMSSVPSIDVTLESAVETYGGRTVAVLLSGMGKDGAKGMMKLKGVGALTMAQDEESSLIYGLNGEAIKSGAVIYTGNPEKLGKELITLFQ